MTNFDSVGDDFLYIFLHLPKCAGTHFARTIMYNWSLQECLMVSPSIRRPLRRREDVDAYIRSVSASRREDVRFLYGHAVYYGIHEHFDRPARYITFLRDPLSRLVSNFLHVRKHFDYFTAEGVQKLPHTVDDLTIGWWLQHSQLNLQTAMILNYLNDGGAGWSPGVQVDAPHLARAQAVLDDFYFVGLYETYDEDALFLFRELRIERRLVDRQNVAREDGDVSSNFDTNAVKAAMALDRQLYTHARTLNGAFKREVRAFDDIVSQAREDMRPVRPLRYVLINQFERLLGQRRALASIEAATECVKRIVGEENVARFVRWLHRRSSARPRRRGS